MPQQGTLPFREGHFVQEKTAARSGQAKAIHAHETTCRDTPVFFFTSSMNGRRLRFIIPPL